MAARHKIHIGLSNEREAPPARKSEQAFDMFSRWGGGGGREGGTHICHTVKTHVISCTRQFFGYMALQTSFWAMYIGYTVKTNVRDSTHHSKTCRQKKQVKRGDGATFTIGWGGGCWLASLPEDRRTLGCCVSTRTLAKPTKTDPEMPTPLRPPFCSAYRGDCPAFWIASVFLVFTWNIFSCVQRRRRWQR